MGESFKLYEKGKLYEIVEDKGVKIVIDPKALMHVYGTKIDFVDDNLSELSVLVDRSVGELSIVYGPLELMFHRRLLYDDGKGVVEALNEIVCVGTDSRRLADGNTTSNFQVSKFLGMDSTYILPKNVVLLTLQELDDGKVLLCLAHLYEVLALFFT
ncbi:hypothetical protein E3N88_17523 [Mikania micrantha]|uniref:Uncharacterized protein n=1 Tax=Mikania micrantha TaxID=192012 RepID=A0A5N6NV52_9ASTR|nr:hypothetical protein E3N88_17523 [Mikania micrantha]